MEIGTFDIDCEKKLGSKPEVLDSLKHILVSMIQEYLGTDGHQMGLLLDADMELGREIDTSIYPELNGIYYIVYRYTDRRLEALNTSLNNFTLPFRSTHLTLCSMLYVDTCCYDTISHYHNSVIIVSNKGNLKELTLHDSFRGALEGVLDGVILHVSSKLDTYTEFDEGYFGSGALKGQVHSVETTLSNKITRYKGLYTNLKRIDIRIPVMPTALQYFECENTYISMLTSGLELNFSLSSRVYDLDTLRLVVAALSLGTITYSTLRNSSNSLTLRALDNNVQDKVTFTTKIDKTGTILELAKYIYFNNKTPDNTVEKEIKEIEEMVDYWKSKRV